MRPKLDVVSSGELYCTFESLIQIFECYYNRDVKKRISSLLFELLFSLLIFHNSYWTVAAISGFRFPN